MRNLSFCLWTTGIRVGRARFDPQNPAWKDTAILKILRDKVKAKIGRQLSVSYLFIKKTGKIFEIGELWKKLMKKSRVVHIIDDL
jgi:hypothetical protein